MDERRQTHNPALRCGDIGCSNQDEATEDHNTLQLCAYDSDRKIERLASHPHIRVLGLGVRRSILAEEAADKMGIVNVLEERCSHWGDPIPIPGKTERLQCEPDSDDKP
jgi:hypothetical protein